MLQTMNLLMMKYGAPSNAKSNVSTICFKVI